MPENDFYDSLDIQLPPDAPQQTESESRSYYKHPVGTYTGFVGRLTAKYRDPNDKPCEPTDVGARFHHYILPLWIKKYLGSNDIPTMKQVITDGLTLPNLPIQEMYFPLLITTDPERGWQYHKIFDSWKMVNRPELTVIKANPANPSKKSVDYKALAQYLGTPIRWVLVTSVSKKTLKESSPYIDSLVIESFDRPPYKLFEAMEASVKSKVEEERAKRSADREGGSGGYVQQEAPAADFSDLGSELEGFLDQ